MTELRERGQCTTPGRQRLHLQESRVTPDPDCTRFGRAVSAALHRLHDQDVPYGL